MTQPARESEPSLEAASLQRQLQLLSQGLGILREDLPNLLARELADLCRFWQLDPTASRGDLQVQVRESLMGHLENIPVSKASSGGNGRKERLEYAYKAGFNLFRNEKIDRLDKGARQGLFKNQRSAGGPKFSFSTAQRDFEFCCAEIEKQILATGFKPEVPLSLLKGGTTSDDRAALADLVQSVVCTGRIDSPRGGAVVEQRIHVTGVVRGLPPGHHVWIVHRIDPGGLFWPKDFELGLDDEGRFERYVYEGGTSHSFFVTLLLTSDAGHQKLSDWVTECGRTGSYPGIPPSSEYVELHSVEARFNGHQMH